VTLRFGTDGVRGVANAELTPELVLRLGRAASRVIGGDDATFYVGRDTRVSGPLLQAALTAGLAAEGASVVDLGVLPTPGVAWLSAADGVPAAMISASHNAFADNGIKFFAAGGRKLPDEVEERLEAELDRLAHPELGVDRARIGTDLRPVRSVAGDAITRYCDALVASLEGRRLDGLHIVVDCAHGAASDVAPAVLRRLGAEVEVIHAQPDGVNINAGCGSTHPESLQRSVVALGADAGLAFDGDQLIAICALDLRSRGGLKDDTVVVTVMTNLGFHLAMAEHGVHVEQTAVGDRYVLEALARGGWSLGGEQSGHVIFSELATTGDGVLTGLQVLDVVRRSGRPLAELASVMTRLPQVLENVRVRDRDALLDDAAALDAEVAAVEAELGDHGRVLIRPSGTEPLVRVMGEAPTPAQASAAAARLVAAVTAVCGTA
jgi:phosphoglucosamine mutase